MVKELLPGERKDKVPDIGSTGGKSDVTSSICLSSSGGG